MNGNVFKMLVCSSLLAAACGEATDGGVDPAGGGGSGGEGGTGGTGGAGGSGGQLVPPDEAPWDGLEVKREVIRRELGDVSKLAAGSFGPTATEGMILGARELIAVTPDAGEVLWQADWAPAHRNAGDFPIELSPVDADADGVTDVVVLDSWSGVHLVDGRDGAHRWSVELDLENPYNAAGAAVFGAEAQPAIWLPATKDPLDAATGAPAFESPLRMAPHVVGSGRPSRDADANVFAAIEPVEGFDDTFVVSPDGTILHSMASAGESFTTALAAADLDGTGAEVMLVGAAEGVLQAIDQTTGETLWRKQFDLGEEAYLPYTYVERIVAADVDGDDREEIFFTLNEMFFSQRMKLFAVDAMGEELWSTGYGQWIRELELAKSEEGVVVVAAYGDSYMMLPGTVVALEASGGDELWRSDLPFTVMGLGVDPSGERVYAGSIDGYLRVRDARTGDEVRNEYRGSYLRPSIAQLDDTVYTIDEYGRVSAWSGEGDRLWHAGLDVEGWGANGAIAAFEEDGSTRIAISSVSGMSWENHGRLEVLDDAGASLWSIHLPVGPQAVAVTDLGADGSSELIVATQSPGYSCAVAAYAAADGTSLWEVPVGDCTRIAIAARGDRVAFAAYADWFTPQLGVVDAAGELLWKEETVEIGRWVELREDALLSGGVYRDGQGFVARRDPETGEASWFEELPAAPHPTDDKRRAWGHSWFGARVPDRDGDGQDEVAVSTETNHVHLLDGATGEKRWTLELGEASIEASDLLFGGPLAVVPGTDEKPPFLVVGQSSWTFDDTALLVVDLAGEIVAAFSNEGSVRAIAVGTDDGNPRATVATSLGLSTIRLE